MLQLEAKKGEEEASLSGHPAPRAAKERDYGDEEAREGRVVVAFWVFA